MKKKIKKSFEWSNIYNLNILLLIAIIVEFYKGNYIIWISIIWLLIAELFYFLKTSKNKMLNWNNERD